MATKKTEKTSTKKAPAGKKAAAKGGPRKAAAKPAAKKTAAPKEKKEKKEPVKVGPRHPLARVKASSGGTKEALAKTLAPVLAFGDDDVDQVEARLKTASNAQLLRLQRVTATVKQKYGSREGLIEAIGKAGKSTKDKDYVAKLETLSLPNLLDLAQTAERSAAS